MTDRWRTGGMALALAVALATAPALAAPGGAARYETLMAEGDAAVDAGDTAKVVAAFDAALAEARRLYPASHPALAAARQGQATALAMQGKMDEAAALIDSVIPVLEQAGPRWRKRYAEALSIKGFIATTRSDHATAIATFLRSIPVFREVAAGKPDKGLAIELSNLAGAYWEAGRPEDSLALNAEALAMGRQLNPVPPDLALWTGNRVAYLHTLGRSDEAIATAREGLAFAEAKLPPGNAAVANLYANLGAMLVRQGRPKTATPFLRHAFESAEAANGGPNQNSAVMRVMFAQALADSGANGDALAFLDQAIPLIEGQLGPESNRAMQARETRALTLSRLGQGAEALAQQARVIEIRDRKLAPQHRDRMNGRAVLARIALAMDDPARAEAALVEAVTLRQAAVPPAHPDLLAEKALLLLARSRTGSLPKAALLREAHEVYDRLVANATANPEAPLLVSARVAFSSLAEAFATGGDADAAFQAQQWSVRSSVDAASATAAARRAGTAQAPAIEARRKLAAERAGLMAAVETQLAAPRAGFDLAAQAARLAEVDTAIAAADAALVLQGIRFAQPHAATLAEAGQRIGKGALFLEITPLHDRYLVTAIGAGKPVQYLTAERQPQIAALVGEVRASLDPAAEGDFARGAAASLYRALVRPALARRLGSARRLYVSAHGAFGALPLAVLVPDERGGGYLADRLAIVRLPNAPQQDVTAGGVIVPGLLALGGVETGPGAARPSRGFAIEGLAQLPALPQARQELADIATVIGAREPRILTGGAATEAALSAAPLAPGGVLAFATHGLVSGAYEGLAEPALVLSPDGGNDGLLLASEIARLDLPASWVVLSACNTAAGSGPDAQSLSGLAQAFMLAGAQRVLATHWPVRDDMARALTGATLRRAAAGVEPAEALRQAMAEVRRSGVTGADRPVLWAAFELVAP